MHLTITEERFNYVAWEVRPPLTSLVARLIIGGALILALLMGVGSTQSMRVVWIVTVVSTGVLFFIVWLVPMREEGYLERIVTGGGTVVRVRRWFLRREEEALPLEAVRSLRYEEASFEEAGERVYTLARLWAETVEGEPLQLTPWLEPEEVQALGQAMARAGRLPLEVQEA